MVKIDFEKKRLRWKLILIGLFCALIFTVIITTMIGTMGPLGQGNPEKIPLQAVLDILSGKS